MESTNVRVAAADGTELAACHLPAPRGAPGVVVVHGLGSRKENHLDFAALAADRGLAVVAVDLRGHGQSAGALGPGILDDVLAAVGLLEGAGHDRIGLRGSSLGGFLALHAAERRPAVRAVVAICPATAGGLSRRLGESWPATFGELGERPLRPGVARGYWHARGDEQVHWAGTFALANASPPPRRLRIAMGGSHHSLQHDPLVQEETVNFLAASLAAP